jgi:hypothetical protein
MGYGQSDDRATQGPHEHDCAFVLSELRERLEALLPWMSRTTGRPVGMWVEKTGFVSSPHEPFPVGTPFANICAANLQAAEAVREELAAIARLDEIYWQVGWRGRDGEARMIRIYPRLADLGIDA